MPGKFNQPAGPTDTGNPEAGGGGTGDAPAGPGRRRLAERIPVASAVTPKQQNRNIGLCRSKLKAAGRHHRHLACLGNDRSRRPIADSVLDDGKKRSFVTRLRMNDIGRAKSGLFQAGSVEVIAAAYPQYRGIERSGFTHGYPRQKQGRGGIIDQRAGQSGRLVQRAGTEASAAQATIQRLGAKRACAKLSERRRQGAQMLDC